MFIFGTNFDAGRLVSRSLTSFYGIGPQVCTRLMARFHIHKTAKIGALSDRQINDLAAELSTMTLENDLRRQLVDNIKRLRDMGTYRGRRHAMGLPVRGQKTRTQVCKICDILLVRSKLTTNVDPNGEKDEQDRQARIRTCTTYREAFKRASGGVYIGLLSVQIHTMLKTSHLLKRMASAMSIS